jgi:hypothetical protein
MNPPFILKIRTGPVKPAVDLDMKPLKHVNPSMKKIRIPGQAREFRPSDATFASLSVEEKEIKIRQAKRHLDISEQGLVYIESLGPKGKCGERNAFILTIPGLDAYERNGLYSTLRQRAKNVELGKKAMRLPTNINTT